jgi:predicted nucleic acid-binding protein
VSLVYWDPMLFIYWLEAHPKYGPQVEQIHRRMAKRNDTLCTSVFTLGEILTGAYKANGQEQAERIRRFFESGALQLLPFEAKTANMYARIRAGQNVSPADAIHLASASLASVDVYLTNDTGLKKLLIPGIKFIAGLDGSIF